MLQLALLLIGLLFSANSQAAQTADSVSTRAFHEIALPDAGAAPAQVMAPNDTLMAAEVTARIARIPVEVGTLVKAGDLLLELDATDYQLALAQADAQVSAARARMACARNNLCPMTPCWNCKPVCRPPKPSWPLLRRNAPSPPAPWRNAAS